MRSKRSRQIGVLIRNNRGDRYTHPLTFETILGINEGLEAEGYVLSIVRIDDVQTDAAPGSRVFRERLLDGMVIIDSLPEHAEARVEKLVPNIVWADAGVWRDHWCVRRDEVDAGRRAAQALVDLGYRDIVWAGIRPNGRLTSYSRTERLEGVRSVTDAAGIKLREIEVFDGRADHAPAELDAVLRPHVGVIAYGVYQARAIQQLAATVRRVPGYDFGLVSCDGSRDIERFWPGLSRVGFDRFGLGVEAARLMIALVERPEEPLSSVRIPGEWQPGNTAWGPT
jgi:DNA-binding LacI/PurR family transcriptional regulator